MQLLEFAYSIQSLFVILSVDRDKIKPASEYSENDEGLYYDDSTPRDTGITTGYPFSQHVYVDKDGNKIIEYEEDSEVFKGLHIDYMPDWCDGVFRISSDDYSGEIYLDERFFFM